MAGETLAGTGAGPVAAGVDRSGRAASGGYAKTWLMVFRARADRTIAAGRVVLASASLFAIWLDPTQPKRYQGLAYTLLATYTVYALLCAVLAWRSGAPRLRDAAVRHVGDLAAFALFMYLTDGPTSPLFPFLIFAILAGTLHWQWKGTVWTAVACVLILLSLGAADLIDVTDAELGFRTFVIRIVYLGVAAVMLAWLGVHQQEVRAELLRLAEHAPEAPDGTAWPIRTALDYATSVIQAPRAALLWTDAEEPWTFLSIMAGGRLKEEQLPPGSLSPWLTDPLQGASLVVTGDAEGGTLVHQGLGRFERWQGADSGVHLELAARLAAGSIVTVAVKAAGIEARLFLLDIPNASLDDVLIAEVVAGRLAALLEQARLVGQLRTAAASEERVRIARDLHDGVLQSLAGAALQLRSLPPLIARAPDEAVTRLALIEDALAAEQRDLRAFIELLEPRARGPSGGEVRLDVPVLLTIERLRRRWSLDLQWRIEPVEAQVAPSLAYDVCQLIAEATANAARHGGARKVVVSLLLQADMLRLEIEDDGLGFVFDGRLDAAELEALRLGPRSLRERAAARGGRLAVDSGPEGARITISLPLAPMVPA